MKILRWDITKVLLKELIVQGFWFCLLASVMYFGLKAPIMYLFTSIMGINYIVGGFLAGIVVTIITFFFSKFWVFTDKSKLKRRKVAVL